MGQNIALRGRAPPLFYCTRMPHPDSQAQNRRDFARQVVIRLREAGHEALWAGGCVRDDLLGLTPEDYDVATSATPEEVIRLFGRRRTVPVGASFGVVMVLPPHKSAGQVEVATFRTDGQYLDGRRPESVAFCSPEEDARRRDFTINGMFFDPVAKQVIDYVGGQEDLQRKVLKAIGDPTARFAEDKLRMLRAVRFAATYQLSLDSSTAAAVRAHAADMTVVSAERIAAELKRMLAHPTRSIAFQLMLDLHLANVLFPEFEIGPHADQITRSLAALQSARFEPAMAVLLQPLAERCSTGPSRRRAQQSGPASVCRRLKFSNAETDDVGWLLSRFPIAQRAAEQPLHVTKTLLADSRCPLLIDLLRASAAAHETPAAGAEHLSQLVRQLSPDEIDPPPLIDGSDVKQTGLPPGKVYARILQQIRNEQLDEIITTRGQAVERMQSLAELYRSDTA